MKSSVAAFVAVCSILGGNAAIAGPDASDVLAVIQKFNEAGNAGDRQAYAAYCAQDAVVVDHVPPHTFRGAHACRDDWDAIIAWEQRYRLVDKGVTLAKPSFVDVLGDSAYVAIPATASLTQDGKPVVEQGVWTFTLHRQAQGWRISGTAWATLSFAPDITQGR